MTWRALELFVRLPETGNTRSHNLRALSLVFSSSASKASSPGHLASVTTMLGVLHLCPPPEMATGVLTAAFSQCSPQLNWNLASLPRCPSSSLVLSLLVRSLRWSVPMLLPLPAVLLCSPFEILFGLITLPRTTHHRFGSSGAVALSFCSMPGRFPGPTLLWRGYLCGSPGCPQHTGHPQNGPDSWA